MLLSRFLHFHVFVFCWFRFDVLCFGSRCPAAVSNEYVLLVVSDLASICSEMFLFESQIGLFHHFHPAKSQ